MSRPLHASRGTACPKLELRQGKIPNQLHGPSRCPAPHQTAHSNIFAVSKDSSRSQKANIQVDRSQRTRGESHSTDNAQPSIWKGLASTGLAAAMLVTTAVAPPDAGAIFNSGDAIPNPEDALPAVLASRQALLQLKDDITEMSKDCPAPTFPCDLSQLLKKASGRVSGPLGRTLPTLVNELGVDPYASDDVLQSMIQAESILKSNNARVKVDWTGPVEMLALADASLSQVLDDVDPDMIKDAQGRVDACDKTIDPREEGPLECRLVRALYSKSLAPGIS